MTHSELILSNNLVNEFKICTQLQYNGKLNIKSSKGSQWTFYYRLGRIVWATGGTHPFRRWRRHIAQNCPQIDVDKLLETGIYGIAVSAAVNLAIDPAAAVKEIYKKIY